MWYFRNDLSSDLILCEHVQVLDAKVMYEDERDAKHAIPVRVRCEVCEQTFELTLLVD